MSSLAKASLSADSKKRLAEVVEQLLANKDISMKWIPDFIERRLYNNALVLAMAALEEALKTSEVHFLGHRLTFSLHPLPDPAPADAKADAHSEAKPVHADAHSDPPPTLVLSKVHSEPVPPSPPSPDSSPDSPPEPPHFPPAAPPPFPPPLPPGPHPAHAPIPEEKKKK